MESGGDQGSRQSTLGQGARGAIAGIGAVAAILVIGGMALYGKESGDYNGCLDKYRGEVGINPYSRCAEASAAGPSLMILGALILAGVLAAYFAMRSGTRKASPTA